jgi:hypothetical protein
MESAAEERVQVESYLASHNLVKLLNDTVNEVSELRAALVCSQIKAADTQALAIACAGGESSTRRPTCLTCSGAAAGFEDRAPDPEGKLKLLTASTQTRNRCRCCMLLMYSTPTSCTMGSSALSDALLIQNTLLLFANYE